MFSTENGFQQPADGAEYQQSYQNLEEQYKSKINDLQQHISFLESQNSEINRENLYLKQKISLQGSPSDIFNLELDKYRAENESLRKTYQEKLNQAEQLISSFKDQILKLQTENTNLKVDQEKIKFENERLLTDNQRIQNQNEGHQHEISQLQELITSLKNQNSELNLQLQEFLKQNSQEKEDYSRFIQSISHLLGVSKPDEIIINVRNLLKELNDSRKISKDGTKIINELEIQKSQNEQLQKQLNEAHSQLINALSSSTLANAGVFSPIVQSQSKVNEKLQSDYDQLLNDYSTLLKENEQLRIKNESTQINQMSELFNNNSKKREKYAQDFLNGTISYLNLKGTPMSNALAQEFENEENGLDEIKTLWSRYDEIIIKDLYDKFAKNIESYMNIIDINMEQIVLSLGKCQGSINQCMLKLQPKFSIRKSTPLKQPVPNREKYPSQYNSRFLTPRPNSSNIFTPI